MPTQQETWTRAVNVEGLMSQLPSATTAELADIADPINTSDRKKAGVPVFNSTTGAIVVSTGANDNSVWNTAAGALAHTPV